MSVNTASPTALREKAHSDGVNQSRWETLHASEYA